MKIKIVDMEAWSDCETCGGGSEYGGQIFFDGKLVWEDIPIGACFDGNDFDREYKLKKALELLGHEVDCGYDD